MKTIFIKISTTVLVGFFFSSSFAQNTERYWTKVSKESVEGLPKVNRKVFPKTYDIYALDLVALKQDLQGAPIREELSGLSNLIISFPTSAGTLEKFRVMESPIMHPDLAAKYPSIKTYAAQGVDDPTATMRFSVTQFGLHTMTLSGIRSSNFIDPYTSDRNYYIVYEKASLSSPAQPMECLTEEGLRMPSLDNGPSTVANSNDRKLRKYRLAQSCNAEYGNIFALTPGTEKADIQAQMAITMNRVNGVYERDLAVTMEFVANNDLIIYFGNTNSDPWTNEWNTKTAQTIDAAIGVTNYDIGHNFNTTGGGNAGCISCVCLSTSQTSTHKGRGYTGSSNPTGDPFDIDYVAHEMGHQFGGYHVMNTCSRSGSGSTEVEPASGSSVMGYAGICPTNVQANSHDDFNYVNVRDISANIQTGNSTCATIINLTNNPPTASAGNDYVIPKSTAYVLEGTATDPDGTASLTYNWSQNDPAQSPGNAAPLSTYTVGPLYRALPPSTSPNRWMPKLTDVIAGNLTPTWEVTPSVGRIMNFSFIVRDNDVNGGQTASDLMKVTVDGNSGPFVVTSQNTAVTWNAGASETITWNVAGTATGAVNTPNVNILLSLDGGFTYPITLASGVPNNGSAIITVPINSTTTTGRVMVRGANNIFYDINNTNITIQNAEFVMNFATNTNELCPPSTANYNFTYTTFLNFNETTTFSATGNPPGTTVTFNPSTASVNGTPVQVTVSGITPAMSGAYNIAVTGTSTSVTKTTNINLSVLDVNPPVATLTSPLNGATGVTTTAILTWAASSSPGMEYDIDIATDPAFTNIIQNAVGLTTNSYTATSLITSTTYYWRVKAYNNCVAGNYSSAFNFTTNTCNNLVSANVPVSISASGTPTVTSNLTVNITGTITDVNVVNLTGTHTWINDLTIRLKSPAGTIVTLFGAICNNEDNFAVNFDDAATAGALPCPPVGNGTYQPQTPLSAFNGQNANGTWTLTVVDGANQDGGALNSWALEICTSSTVGIFESSKDTKATIFPNPGTGLFNINLSGLTEDSYKVKVLNSLGQVVFEKNSTLNNTKTCQIDLSDKQDGVYFLVIQGNKNITTERIILQR